MVNVLQFANEFVVSLPKNQAKTIGTLNLPAGSYLITAKATMLSFGSTDVYCALQVGTIADEGWVSAHPDLDTISLTLPATLSSAGQAFLICAPDDDNAFAFYRRIVALPIGGFTTAP